MKKTFLLAILMVLVFAFPALATDYYACQAAQNLTGDATWCTAAQVSGSCAATSTRTAWATVAADSPSLFANGCTVVVNDGFTAVKISTEDGDGAGAAVAGGGFTLATGTVSGKTITANIVAGTTTCLSVSGSGAANPVLTIIGNVTAGGSSGAVGITDTHNTGTLVIGSVGTPTTITAGTSSTAHGITSSGSSGAIAITGNIVGSTGIGINHTSALTYTITGNCTGNTASVSAGCQASSTGTITISGNIINTARAPGAVGNIVWNPTSTGTTWNYIKVQGDTATNFLYLTESPAVAKVENNFTYGFDGATYYTGTLAGGGGTTAHGF